MNNLAHAITGATVLFAAPYNIDARGFYFSSAEEFTDKADKLRDRWGNPVEEFELDYIEGDDGQLFHACGIDQTNLAVWFDDIESLQDNEKAALFYLIDCNGYALPGALECVQDVILTEGPLLEAATELFDECYLPEIPEACQNYIDYEAFANDCRLSGDMAEFRFQGETWTCTNAGEV